MRNIELGERVGDVAKYALALAVAIPPGAALVADHINERRADMCRALAQGEAPDSSKYSLLQSLIYRGATPENLPAYCRESGLDPEVGCVKQGMKEAVENGLAVSAVLQSEIRAEGGVCEKGRDPNGLM